MARRMIERGCIHPTLNISLALVQQTDLEDLIALRIDAMRESLERIGRFDPVRARQRFQAGFSPEHTRHIMMGCARIGFIVVKPDEHGLLLDHLYIHSEHQGHGIGAAVLMHVFGEADAQCLAVRVGALRGSDSNRFYVRHGFQKTEEGDWDIYYVRLARKFDARVCKHEY